MKQGQPVGPSPVGRHTDRILWSNGGPMKINRFEDLECWQAARSLTKSIYGYAGRAGFSKDFRLPGQITGAASSIMNNICEGFDPRSDKEFIRFLFYSRRSCSEVQNCLYIASDQEYISSDEFHQAYDDRAKIRKIIDGFIRYLKGSNSSTTGNIDNKTCRQQVSPAVGLTGRRATG